MRVIVCGGRDYQDRKRVFAALDKLHAQKGITCVIHGACSERNSKELRGADRWADEWAKEEEVPVDPYPADWIHYGRMAGPVRNQQMINEAAPGGVVAFPGGKGTADMCRRAEEPPPIGGGLKIWYPCGKPD